MENTTRISDLPEIKTQTGNSPHSSFPNPNGNNYIPINIHPNPYGNQAISTTGIITPVIPPPSSQYYEGNGTGAVTNSNISGEGHYRLPSRDIRFDTNELIQDDEIRANYIPKKRNMTDYLKEYENNGHEEELRQISKHKKNKKHVRFTDDLFVQLQMPILVGILFFIFQQGIFNRILKKLTDNFINIYNEDGTIGIYGNLAKSILFSISFFGIVKSETLFLNF